MVLVTQARGALFCLESGGWGVMLNQVSQSMQQGRNMWAKGACFILGRRVFLSALGSCGLHSDVHNCITFGTSFIIAQQDNWPSSSYIIRTKLVRIKFTFTGNDEKVSVKLSSSDLLVLIVNAFCSTEQLGLVLFAMVAEYACMHTQFV